MGVQAGASIVVLAHLSAENNTPARALETVRRRLRAIYRIHEAELKSGYDIVIVCRAASVEASYQRLERDFLRIMRKNDLMRKKEKEGERP